jgi:hypothetical protein
MALDQICKVAGWESQIVDKRYRHHNSEAEYRDVGSKLNVQFDQARITNLDAPIFSTRASGAEGEALWLECRWEPGSQKHHTKARANQQY